MWTPVVAFVNTETNERSVVDKYASMRVEKRTDMEKWNESAGSEGKKKKKKIFELFITLQI